VGELPGGIWVRIQGKGFLDEVSPDASGTLNVSVPFCTFSEIFLYIQIVVFWFPWYMYQCKYTHIYIYCFRFLNTNTDIYIYTYI